MADSDEQVAGSRGSGAQTRTDRPMAVVGDGGASLQSHRLASDEQVQRLEAELRVTRERLQATIEELESTNEKLKSSNAEYQSINEELQSASQEMETSKEALQSVNEALHSVNSELGRRVTELASINSDVKNLLESTGIATVFLDNDLRVRNFTPAATDIFHLLETDVGRPLDHVVSRVAYPELAEDVRRVLKTLTTVERTVSDRATGRHFAARVLPYRSIDNDIGGAVVTFTDLTAVRQAETALRDIEERFRTMADNVPVLIWETDDSGVISVNGHYLEFVGAPLEDVRGMGWANFLHPDDAQAYLDAYRLAFEERRSYEYECRFRRADGQWRWLRNRGKRVGDADMRFVGASLDVTDLLEAQQSLRESEERLFQFGEASQDVLWIRDAETFQWEYLTPAFETIYGLDRASALRGDNMAGWVELIVPEDRERAVANIGRVREGEWATFEYRVQRPVDGQIRWLRNTDFPIKDHTGRVAHIGGIGHDITPLRETSEALAAAELRQRALVEGIPQLLWRAVDGGEWTWASPQWGEYTGLTEDESHGRGWLAPLHPDDRPIALGVWDAAQARGGFDVEYRIRHAGTDTYRWFQTRSTPVRGERGEIVEWLGASTDIDDLRNLQERQKVLVAELQHRTRNLIGVVRSIADKTQRASVDLPDFRTRFRDRLEALARVQGLLSRLSEQDRVSFDELVRTELSAMDGDAGRVTLDGPDGVRLRSSMVQTLALAVHELATNAVKYGALGQPQAHLSVSWSLEQDGAKNQPWLHIDWRESGVTMPAPATRPNGVGQGRELIERALPYQLSAETTYTLGPDGVHCTISIPVSATNLDQEADNG